MERIVSFGQPFDKRSSDPNKNYGIHGMDVRCIIKGELGAVQFLVFTNKMMAHVQKELVEREYSRLALTAPERKEIKHKLLEWAKPFTKGKEFEELIEFQKWYDSVYPKKEGVYTFNPMFIFAPMPADLGYHSPKPMYEGHTRMGEENMDDIRENMKIFSESIRGGEIVEGRAPIEVRKTPEKDLPICEYIGCPCYYDGSGLNAQKPYDILISKGEEAMWKYLEKYYESVFGELK